MQLSVVCKGNRMKIRHICEEFATSTTFFGKYFEIFSNPSHRELLSAASERSGIRFIIDFKKEIFYAFSENLLHKNAAEKLEVPYFFPNWDNNNYAFGIGFLDGTRVSSMLDNLDTTYKRKQEIRSNEHKWLRRYITF